MDKEFAEAFKEEIELDEMKWEAGVVYHQEFKNGDKVYFRADSVQKNKRWKGLSVDEFGGRQKKAKNASADEKQQGWETTPKNEIPKGLKEEVEVDEASRSDTKRSCKQVANRMKSIRSMKPFTSKVAKMKTVSVIDLERMLPADKVSMSDIDNVMQDWGWPKDMQEEAPANKTGVNVVGTGDDPTVWVKKKKRINAKVKWEDFGGTRVYVVPNERWHASRLGKTRYARYEKYIGNDKLGETIRLYGRENPKSPIILKNEENGAMLYLKYGGSKRTW